MKTIPPVVNCGTPVPNSSRQVECSEVDRSNADSKDFNKVASPRVDTAPGEVSKGVAVPYSVIYMRFLNFYN